MIGLGILAKCSVSKGNSLFAFSKELTNLNYHMPQKMIAATPEKPEHFFPMFKSKFKRANCVDKLMEKSFQ